MIATTNKHHLAEKLASGMVPSLNNNDIQEHQNIVSF